MNPFPKAVAAASSHAAPKRPAGVSGPEDPTEELFRLRRRVAELEMAASARQQSDTAHRKTEDALKEKAAQARRLESVASLAAALGFYAAFSDGQFPGACWNRWGCRP